SEWTRIVALLLYTDPVPEETVASCPLDIATPRPESRMPANAPAAIARMLSCLPITRRTLHSCRGRCSPDRQERISTSDRRICGSRPPFPRRRASDLAGGQRYVRSTRTCLCPDDVGGRSVPGPVPQ